MTTVKFTQKKSVMIHVDTQLSIGSAVPIIITERQKPLPFRLNQGAIRKLKDIFTESAFFRGFPLTDILLVSLI